MKKQPVNAPNKLGLILLLNLLLTACGYGLNFSPESDYSQIIKNKITQRFILENKSVPNFEDKTVKLYLEDFNVVYQSLLKAYYAPIKYEKLEELATASIANHSDFTNDPKSIAKVIDSAILALLEDTDKWTELLSKEEYKQKKENDTDSREAYGFMFSRQEEGILIKRIYKGSELSEVGIEVDDIIIAFDDIEYKTYLNPEVLIDYLKSSDSIKFTVKKPDGSILSAKVSRAEINFESVLDEKIIIQDQKSFFYLKIESFNRETAKLFKVKYESLLEQNQDIQPYALIIDLRDNPGGFLSVVAQICDYFIDSGTFYKVITNKNTMDYSSYHSDLADDNLKFATLINNNSASASEILTGCLYYQRNALLLGETSYGKNKGQHTVKLNMGRALKISTLQILTDLDTLTFYPFIPHIEIIDDPETDNDEVVDKAIQLLGDESFVY